MRYERSANFLGIARRNYPDLTFREIDVLSPDYPDREADMLETHGLPALEDLEGFVLEQVETGKVRPHPYNMPVNLWSPPKEAAA